VNFKLSFPSLVSVAFFILLVFFIKMILAYEFASKYSLVKNALLKMEQSSQNENVTRIKNEFCEIFPNKISLEKNLS
jgi:hypothetical protein